MLIRSVRQWLNLRLLPAAVALLALGGCGYQWVGQSSMLPKDAQTVYVEPFIGRSRDIGLEKELTSALRSEFYRRGQLRVVDAVEQADIILSGVVRSFETSVASVNRQDEVLQYVSVLVLDATLRRREPNEILWRGQALRLAELQAGSRAAVVTTSSEFRTNALNTNDVRNMTDIQLSESERRDVRDKLMERFAKELHQRIMEMF
ncbi:MAG TPA: LPS assembly lipoprotein LptE [Candidatus Binatia bacterium]|nr:LPS assembly lipoprotein LptE [Candidatus Binatia bacterium]